MRHTLILLLLLLSQHSFAKTYYVSQSAGGARDGSSWVNAFTNLRWALSVAVSGDIIKVAAGVYTPSSVSYADSSFTLSPGVSLLGGYPATGNPTDANRDWVNQPTYLTSSLSAGTVVMATGIDTATVFDGFFVTQGNGIANGYGGGMQISQCRSLSLQHIIFQNNYDGAVSLINSQVVFTDCVMNQNNAGTGLIYQTTGSNSAFYNCIICGNTTISATSYMVFNQDATVQLINCSIVNNGGPAFYGSGTGAATILNTIFWNNLVNNSELSADILPGGQTLNIANCLTQTYYQSGINTIFVNDNPRFYNIANPAGADNKFFTADDGLQLTAPCSPALNSGDNNALAGLITDILGNPRIYDGTVDLGAYELQTTPGQPLTTVYVNTLATGAGNGSSWEDAFTTLQQALLYCADTVKVAAGTYPTGSAAGDNAFKIESRKVILGGYPATGNPTDAGRNPNLYQTLLQASYPVGSAADVAPVLEAFHSDSSTRIDGLAFSNGSFLPYDGGSVPGLHIGYGSKLQVAHCQFQFASNGSSSGGGVLISDSSSPVITRSTMILNVSNYNNGNVGIACLGNSSPAISFCQFTGTASTNNSSTAPAPSGYGINFTQCTGTVDSCTFNLSLGNSDAAISTTASTVQMTNCVLRAANSTGYLLTNINGGNTVVNNCIFKCPDGFSTIPTAIYNNHSSPIFSKCLFDSTNISVSNVNHSSPVFNNCVSINGQFMQNNNSSPQLNNCTIINTYVSAFNLNTKALIINSDSSILTANNSIFWGSQLAAGWKDIADTSTDDNPAQNGTSLLNNCITRNYGQNGVNGNLVGINPRVVQLANIYGPDGIMFTADDGIRLALCSPAINAGNNALGTVLATDVLGNPRIFGGTVDIGAYELQQSPLYLYSFYVNANAGGSADGSSWANAYPSFQTAICNACADTIRAAAGTYMPAVSDRDSTFLINRPVTLYGGYPNSGAPTDAQRDPFGNPTILSGDIGIAGESTDNTETIITAIGVPDSVTIDGFVIRDGHSTASGISLGGTGGAAISANNNKMIIRNCQFLNNHAGLTGGAIAFGGSDSCSISHSIFTGNSAGDYGGAIASQGAYLQLANCEFDGNYAYGQGGAIQLYGIFDMKGCLFYRNYTTTASVIGRGGAIDASMSNGTIANCTFVQNRSGYQYPAGGGGVYTNLSLSVRVKNCIFEGNISGGSTTASGTDLDWEYNTVFNCLLQSYHNFTGSTNLYGTTAGFTDSLLPMGRDGRWLTADDGLQLLYNSQAVNFGNNSAVTGLATDILGNPRIVGGIVDAGAYEYQDKPFADAGMDTTICSDDTIRIGKGGDPSYTYTWTSNPAGYSSTSAIALIQPTVPTTYYLVATDGTTTSNDSVLVTTTSSITPAIAITTDTNVICQGSSAVFAATSVYGGDSALYQWQVNGVNAGTNGAQFTSTTLADSSKVAALLTSSISCATPRTVSSNTITMQVGAYVAPAVTLITPQDTVCTDASATVIAVPVNGGTHPTYQWLVNGNGNYISTDTLMFNANDSVVRVYVVMTSTNICATPTTAANQITVRSISRLTPAVTIVASQTAICAGGDVVFTANAVNGGSAPSYQWLVNGIDSGADSHIYDSRGLRNGDIVSAILTSDVTCASPSTAVSNPVTVSVSAAVTPAITISGTTSGAGQPVELTANIVDGGNSPGYQWQDSTDASGWQAITGATGDSLTYMPPTTASAVRCLLTSDLACITQNTVSSAPLTFNVRSTTPTSDSASIRYYPNPVQGLITIDSLQASDGWQTVQVMSADGQGRMLSTAIAGRTTVTLDLATLPKGVYILCLVRESGSNIYKMILKL